MEYLGEDGPEKLYMRQMQSEDSVDFSICFVLMA